MFTSNLQRDIEYAEFLIEATRQAPACLLEHCNKNSTSKVKSIHQKLLDLYIEECGRQPDNKALHYATHLLPKLVKRERLNCLILNLYPANEGYSLMLKGRNGIESETIKLPYEESELLEYIDAAELPPILVDILEKAQVNVFYSGCVIVEVRDCRRSTSGCYDSEYVMLKPTMQSLLCDINSITNDGHRWTQEDVFQLESQLLLATQDPLCLDPSPAVFFITNHMQYENRKFNTPALKRSVKKFTQAAVNRKRKFAQGPAPKELRLLDFIHRKKDKRGTPPVNLKSVDMWKQKPVHLAAPETIDVEKYSQVIEKQKNTNDNIPIVIEQHVLERENGGKTFMAKLVFLQRPSDEFYNGELFVDHNYVPGQSKGSCCKFPMGNRDNVDKYLDQFKEIFTEEGRRCVKITTTKPGQAPVVTYTQTGGSTNNSMMSVATNQESSSSGRKCPAQQNQHLSLSMPQTMTNSGPTMMSPNSAVLSPTIGNPTVATQQSNQTAHNLHQQVQQHVNQSQLSSQKFRQYGMSSTSPSPVSAPNSVSSQHSGCGGSTGQQQTNQKTPTPTPTPTPPPPAPTPPSTTIRRSSTNESATVNQGLQHQNSSSTTFLSGAESTSSGLGQTQSLPSGINITSLPRLPANLNIQNLASLPGVNITNLQGLQNMQVSLGGIALPVPSGLLQNQAGIFVSSIPGITTGPTSGVATPSTTTTATTQSTSSLGTSQPALVTMVTALPQTTSTSTTATTTSVPTQGAITTGVITNPASVLPPTQGMLSLPFNLAGNLTQLMSAGLKATSPSLRMPSSVPLVQLQSQQPIQLLNLSQQRAPIQQQQQQPSTTQSQVQQGSSRQSVATTPTLPVTTGLTTQPITAYSQLSVSKSGQCGSTPLTGQSVMHLGGQGSHQSQQQQIQFHQLQLKLSQPNNQQGQNAGASKSKSKKRATPTPPKS